MPLNEVPLNEVANEVANEVSSNEKPINKKMSWKSELQEVQMHISDEPEIKNLLNKLIEKTDYQISLLERLLQNKDNKINIENS